MPCCGGSALSARSFKFLSTFSKKWWVWAKPNGFVKKLKLQHDFAEVLACSIYHLPIPLPVTLQFLLTFCYHG